MSTRRCTGFLGAIFRVVSIGSWALVFGLCGLIGYIMYNGVWKPAFSTGTIVSDNFVGLGLADQEHHYLSWQSPFNYEIKVYTSELPQLPANHSQFFETARLLWHVEPHSIDNRYPRIKKRLQVDVPAAVISKKKPLYAYIFAQREGQFRPHPNTKGPFLAGARTTLLSWPEREQHVGADYRSRQVPVFQSSIHWAMVLENHAYPSDEVPIYLTKTTGVKMGAYRRINLYSPPLMPNLFTTRRPEFETLDVVWDKRRSQPVYSPTFEIEMNIDGIRSGWLQIRQYISAGLRADLTRDVINFTAPYNPKLDREHKKTGPNIGLAFIDENSIVILLVAIVCVSLMACLYLVYLRVLVGYYLGSASKHIGCSRTSILLSIISAVLKSPFYTVVGALGLLTKISLLLDVASICIITQIPLNPWRWVLALRSYIQSDQQNTANALSAESTTGVNGNDTTTREQRIIRIRSNVDESTIGAIRYIGMELSAVVMLYTVFSVGLKSPITVILPSFLAKEATAIRIIKDIPQILTNHRAQSGSLKSVGIPICTFLLNVVSATFMFFAVGSIGVNIPWLIIDIVPDIIQISQWIIYFKVKQD